MKASVTSDMFNYSFRLGLAEKLRLFREHGFEYLHWCDEWDTDHYYSEEETAAAAKSLRDAGVTTLDIHGTSTSVFKIDTEDEFERRGYVKLLENRVRFCATLGGDAVVVHPPKTQGELQVRRAIEALEPVRRLCSDSGVRLAVENCYKGDEATLSRLLNHFDPEFMGFCYDSGHANVHANHESLRGFRDRLLVTHLHDNKGDADSHQTPFWGTVDWKKVTTWLKETSHNKPLNFEVTYYPLVSRGGVEEFLEKTRDSAERVVSMVTVL